MSFWKSLLSDTMKVKTWMLTSMMFFALHADELTIDPPRIWDTDCLPCIPEAECFLPCFEEDCVCVDLMNPLYSNGVLTTEEGGILAGGGLRIQAQNISYTRLDDAECPIHNVYCSGNLLVDYKDRVLTGESFYYDFITGTGKVILGKTAFPPWYIEGEEILLCEDGNLMVINGSITTTEGCNKDVVLMASKMILSRTQNLSADNIYFRIYNIPVFWFPKFHMDLKNTGQSPFGFNFGWGGFLGSHIGVRYQFLNWHEFQAFARLDGYFNRGLGGGLETVYNPLCAPTEWYTRNYYAHDLSIDDPKKRDRYRFQGTFFDMFFSDTTTVNAIYDVVSDGQMAADYQEKDFDLNPAQKTEIDLRTQKELWIARLFSKARVNSFQSVNQELPSFTFSTHPIDLFNTGIITENYFKGSYLNYVYSDNVVPASDFHSGRLEVRPKIYRPIHLGPLILTPEIAGVGIAYSNSPDGHSAGLASGDFTLKGETALSQAFARWKHVIEPYAHYKYLTAPRVSNDDHYIFTIQDAYTRLNLLRFGMRHSFYVKTWDYIRRPLWIDLWANAFFDTPTIPQTIPKGYVNMEFKPTERLFLGLDSGWNFQEHQLDFYNSRIEWTWNENVALALEYRHRSRYDWRKADFYNFTLEATRTEEELLASPLSDRRDTFLARVFCRLSPNWNAKFQLRHGWKRENQPNYTEYQIEVGTVLFEHWRFNFSFEKREFDHRFSMSLKLDPAAPSKKKARWGRRYMMF